MVDTNITYRLEQLKKEINYHNHRCYVLDNPVTGDGEYDQLMRELKGVGNQQKWDTFVKERSGGNGSVVGLPEQVVVAFAAG